MQYLRQPKGFYKSALALMLPIILQNVVTSCMSLADNLMVGGLGETALAAVTMANTVFFVLDLILFGLQSGCSVLVAQYNGRGNKDAINRVLGIGMYVALILTSIVAIATALFPIQIMKMLTNNETLIQPGADYMRIAGFSFVFYAFSTIYISVQRSMENPKIGAYLFTAAGILNIILNYILIYGKCGVPALGCAGAAWATLLSRAATAVIVVFYAARSKLLPLNFKLILRPGKLISYDFVKFSLPVVLNEGLWGLGISLYSVIMGYMPNNTPILAAYTIATNIDRLVSVALFAGGNAAAVIIGRDIGRGNRESLKGEAIALSALSLCVAGASALVMLIVRGVFAESLIFPLMNLSAEAATIAKMMLLLLALIMPLRAMNLTNIVGVFRGGGDVKFGLICDMLPMYCIAIPAAAVSALVLGKGILTVYLWMYSDELIKQVLVIPRLLSGKWVNNITRDNL